VSNSISSQASIMVALKGPVLTLRLYIYILYHHINQVHCPYLICIIFNFVYCFIDYSSARQIVVPVECDQEQFIQALWDHFPNMLKELELCRVNGSRRIVPLSLDSMRPAQIQASHALGRFALYIRPLVGKMCSEI